MVKYFLLICLTLFVCKANAGGYSKGYGGGYGQGLTYSGYGDGGYGSSNFLAGLLRGGYEGGYGGGKYGGGFGDGGYDGGGYGGGLGDGYGGGGGYAGGFGVGGLGGGSVIQTPVVEYQNVVRNVPTIEYQNVPQVEYQTQTVARQVPVYADAYPSYPTNNAVLGPSVETGWLSNSAPVYSGGSAPIYSSGSPIYSSGSAPVYASGSSYPTYPAGGSGSTIVRGDGTYIPPSNTYLPG